MINPIKGKYEKIEKYYLPRLECNTEDYLMLGWENKDAQFKRFSVLNEIIDNNMTILDVGCGLGNLLDYFDSANHHVYYTGIDIISKMISIAGQKKPHGDFRVVDIFKNTIFTHRKFDIVYSSGIFNIDLGNMMNYPKSILYLIYYIKDQSIRKRDIIIVILIKFIL